jgi:enoyl-CoA hydratase
VKETTMGENGSPAFERVRCETPAPGVARVVLARPEARNAQDKQMLYELDRALVAAVRDDAIRVIVVAADGPHYSSGHDLRDRAQMSEFQPVTQWGGFGLPGAEGYMATEQEIYLGLCWRWRNLPKPTIAQVQGKVIAGGLMLVWPFDLVVASDDASFSDPVVAFGVNGHEFFVHAWELGARKAKELLFTGASLSAQECHRLGMVNHVVPRAELESFTLELAKRIAVRPSMGLKLAKQAVNQSLDAQGQWTAVQAAFSLHHLGHSHAAELNGGLRVDPSGAELIRREAKGG